MSQKTTLVSVSAAVTFLLSGQALAEDSTDLETIVVTAQQRVQSENDVPIAMQVLGAEQIVDLGANNLSDVNGYMPGLRVDGSQPTQPIYFLRGIGSGDFGIGTDSPVGIYVDGIYTGKTGGSLMDFNDVSRVEVLKGPQGTLFGRNSAAGAISIVTNQPEQSNDAEGTLRYGSHDAVVAHGMINVALSDTTAVRLSAVRNHSDGWITNSTTGQEMGADSEWGTRLAFRWSPSADTKLVLTWEHEVLDQPATAAFGLVRVAPGTMPTIPLSGAELIDPLNSPLENAAASRETRHFDGESIRFETKLGQMTLTSNTAYRQFHTFNAEDNTGTANPVTFLGSSNAESNSSFQQELKLAAQNPLLDWIAGASFYRVHADQTTTVSTNTDSIDTLFLNNPGAPLFGAPLFGTIDAALGAPGLGLGNPWAERMINSSITTSYSLYGDVIWHLTPTTNLTTGLRETYDKKSMSWYAPPYSATALDDQFMNATGAPFGVTTGALLSALSGGTVPPLTNIIFSNAALTASSPTSAEHHWTNLTPRVVLDQKLGDRTMVYASVARGYNAGGYDSQSPLARFDAEYMTNIELGIKSALPDAHAYVEASVFRYKFTNLQNITLVSAGALPVYDITTSDQSAYGVDLSGNIQIAPHVSFFGATEFLRQRYDAYSYIDRLTGQSVSLDGQPVGTPEFVATGGLRFTWVTFGGETEFLAQTSYTGPARCNTQINEEYGCLRTPVVDTGVAQTRVDLRLGWQSPGGHYGVALLVNNALDKQYLTLAPNAGLGAFTL
ncbi:MAG TPA: TonB-dependent receptor, partial [Pseudonocardiaceae bacterium]|nr:TonB-dependent receptor [Pseudonocardiaceae bacterium]